MTTKKENQQNDRERVNKIYDFVDKATAGLRVYIVYTKTYCKCATVITRYRQSPVSGIVCRTAILGHDAVFKTSMTYCSGCGYDMENSNMETLLNRDFNGYAWDIVLDKEGYIIERIV